MLLEGNADFNIGLGNLNENFYTSSFTFIFPFLMLFHCMQRKRRSRDSRGMLIDH